MKWSTIATLSTLCSVCIANWSVKNGQLSVISHGTTIESKEFSEIGLIKLPLQSSLELTFDTHDGAKGSRAHQTVALISDEENGLQFSFPASSVKTNGKAKIIIPQKSVPSALQAKDSLTLSLLVGSFDGNKPLKLDLTSNLAVGGDPKVSAPKRLEKLPEIYHVFRSSPKTVPAAIAVFFSLVIVALLVATVGFWVIGAGAGLDYFGTAFKSSPLGHLGLLGSLVGFELVFVLYFQGRSIFDTLTSLALIAPVLLFTGSRALREFQVRRETGKF